MKIKTLENVLIEIILLEFLSEYSLVELSIAEIVRNVLRRGMKQPSHSTMCKMMEPPTIFTKFNLSFYIYLSNTS